MNKNDIIQYIIIAFLLVQNISIIINKRDKK